jgi:hypothetical protein
VAPAVACIGGRRLSAYTCGRNRIALNLRAADAARAKRLFRRCRRRFPERIANTVPYKLSQDEAQLYKAVTDYAARIQSRGGPSERQARWHRRLCIVHSSAAPGLVTGSNLSVSASAQGTSRMPSPRVGAAPAGGAIPTALVVDAPALEAEDVEDLEEAPDDEVEAAEEPILDQATAARPIAELKAEIETLGQLEGLALAVRRSGTDRKWRELANLLSEIFTPAAIASGLSEESVAAIPAPPICQRRPPAKSW